MSGWVVVHIAIIKQPTVFFNQAPPMSKKIQAKNIFFHLSIVLQHIALAVQAINILFAPL